MYRLAGAILLVAISGCGPAPSTPAAHLANRADPNADPITDAAFQKDASEVARRTDRLIEAWGPAAFEHVPGRYARLRPREDTGNTTAAYLMEVSGQYYLVTVLPPSGRDDIAQPPKWDTTAIDELNYEQTFSDANVRASFSIFHGKVVLLSFHERSRKLDPDHPSPDDERDETFSCPTCPALGEGGDYMFGEQVRGPSATINALLGTP